MNLLLWQRRKRPPVGYRGGTQPTPGLILMSFEAPRLSLMPSFISCWFLRAFSLRRCNLGVKNHYFCTSSKHCYLQWKQPFSLQKINKNSSKINGVLDPFLRRVFDGTVYSRFLLYFWHVLDDFCCSPALFAVNVCCAETLFLVLSDYFCLSQHRLRVLSAMSERQHTHRSCELPSLCLWFTFVFTSQTYTCSTFATIVASFLWIIDCNCVILCSMVERCFLPMDYRLKLCKFVFHGWELLPSYGF